MTGAAVIGRLRAARGTAPGDFAIAILEPRPVWQANECGLAGIHRATVS